MPIFYYVHTGGSSLFAVGRAFRFWGFAASREKELVGFVRQEGGQVVQNWQVADYTVVPLLDLEEASIAAVTQGTVVNELYIEGEIEKSLI